MTAMDKAAQVLAEHQNCKHKSGGLPIHQARVLHGAGLLADTDEAQRGVGILEILTRYAKVIEKVKAERDRLQARLDAVEALTEEWEAEENEHRRDGHYGIAEGLHVAIESLRAALEVDQ